MISASNIVVTTTVDSSEGDASPSHQTGDTGDLGDAGGEAGNKE